MTVDVSSRLVVRLQPGTMWSPARARYLTEPLGPLCARHAVAPAAPTPARILVVASNTHDPAKKAGAPVPAWNAPPALARGELGPAAEGDSEFVAGGRRYTTSKLANIYFTYGLARRLPEWITVNAFDPGLIPGTGLTRNASAPLRFAARHVMPRHRPTSAAHYGPQRAHARRIRPVLGPPGGSRGSPGSISSRTSRSTLQSTPKTTAASRNCGRPAPR